MSHRTLRNLLPIVFCLAGCGPTSTAERENDGVDPMPGSGGTIAIDAQAPGIDAGWSTGGSAGVTGSACKSVDLIVSVDTSGSMTDELVSLRDVVFPAMAQKMLEVGDGLEDFRVGMIDACPTPANLHTRGALTSDCKFASGKPWMESASPSLVQEFSCVGDIYVEDQLCSGEDDDEQPASAAAAALVEPMNAGFLRDDALLVVVAVTDEDEQPVPKATPAEVYQKLIAQKSDAAWVVFVGVGGADGCNGVYGHANHAKKLKETTALFGDRGVFWDLCSGKLEDGLGQAIESIHSACQTAPAVPR